MKILRFLFIFLQADGYEKNDKGIFFRTHMMNPSSPQLKKSLEYKLIDERRRIDLGALSNNDKNKKENYSGLLCIFNSSSMYL